MKHQWLYQNDSGRRVRLRVGGTHVGDVGPGGTAMVSAGEDERLSVRFVGEAVGAEKEPKEAGRVSHLCVPWLAVVAKIFGVSANTLARKLKDAAEPALHKTYGAGVDELARRPKDAGGTPGAASPEEDEPPEEEPPHPGTELGPADFREQQAHAATATAWFVMRDRGGMHARPAILVQKALAPLEFEYVEAAYGARVARLYGPQARLRGDREKLAAFWMLLLRLEAYRGAVLSFTARAATQAQAEGAIEAVAGVLEEAEPARVPFWKELGLEGFLKTYVEESLAPAAKDIEARYRTGGKAQVDALLVFDHFEPADPTPVASRVRPPASPEAGEQRLYLRFGHVPESGRTGAYQDGELVACQAGTSCFVGRLKSPTEYELMGPHSPEAPYYEDLLSMCSSGREAFFAVGEEVGIGHRGEVLLDVGLYGPAERWITIEAPPHAPQRVKDAVEVWDRERRGR